MFDISNNNIITITRGDSAMTTLAINIGTDANPFYYSLQESDKVYFGITEPNMPFEAALVKKVFDINHNYTAPKALPSGGIIPGHIHIVFSNEDTVNLMPGVYYYSIKLYRPSAGCKPFDYDRVDTIIDKRKFIIID